MGQLVTAAVTDRLSPETQRQMMDLDTFVQWQPDEEGRYELIDGIPKKMQPAGPHTTISTFLTVKFGITIHQNQLPYTLSTECLVQAPDDGTGTDTGYIPDLCVIARNRLAQEKQWTTSAVIKNGTTLKLVVEVVSTNWQNDYSRKLTDYEQLGIQEYWIVDYRGLGAARYIGTPKRPTITILQLRDGEYTEEKFRAGDKLVSGVFPDLPLTADEIFAAAE
ncbi:MAG: Uma2 family endonuclease [Cyanophyceae cyanobacterium]